MYWVRVHPSLGMYNVLRVQVHNIKEDYFTCIDLDSNNNQTYYFTESSINNRIFEDKKEAEAQLAALRKDSWGSGPAY